jgi:hypothetical protein
MACLNAAGNTLHVQYSIPVRYAPGKPGNYQSVMVKVDYPYPSLTGGISITLAPNFGGGSDGCNGTMDTASLCNPAPLP